MMTKFICELRNRYNLSSRGLNALLESKIETRSVFHGLTRDKILKMPSVGAKTACELLEIQARSMGKILRKLEWIPEYKCKPRENEEVLIITESHELKLGCYKNDDWFLGSFLPGSIKYWSYVQVP